MKAFILACALSLTALPAFAETVIAHIPAMECADCADPIKQALEDHPAVEKVDIDIKNHDAVITVKDGKALSDKHVKIAVEGAGFLLDGITRKE